MKSTIEETCAGTESVRVVKKSEVTDLGKGRERFTPSNKDSTRKQKGGSDGSFIFTGKNRI